MTITAVNLIINKPREAPIRHFTSSSRQNSIGTDRPEPSRLPATSYFRSLTALILRTNPPHWPPEAGAANLLEMVNGIRAVVNYWQTSGFLHPTRITRNRIGHCTELPTTGEFTALRGAILTAIWLTESGALYLCWPHPHQRAGRRQQSIQQRHTPRPSPTMVTGDGKTAVMAALMLWRICNHHANPIYPKFTNRFLAITPGITVRQQLESGHSTGNMA